MEPLGASSEDKHFQMQSRESKQRSWLKMIMEKGKRNCNHTYLLQIYAIGFDSDDLTQNQKNITYGVIA